MFLLLGPWYDTYLCVSHTCCSCHCLLRCLCLSSDSLIAVLLVWVSGDLRSPVLAQQDVYDFWMALERGMDQRTLAIFISMAHLPQRGNKEGLMGHWYCPVSVIRWSASHLFMSSVSQNRSWNRGEYTLKRFKGTERQERVFCHGNYTGHTLHTYNIFVPLAHCTEMTLTLAPFLQSMLTMSACPAAAAKQRGVMPLSVVPSTGAPISSSRATISICPRWAWTARMGACPTTSVHQVTLAPPIINRRLTCRINIMNSIFMYITLYIWVYDCFAM